MTEMTPISPWGYVGYQVLFAIPILGFICELILAISAKNQNVKNFARAQFCVMIIVFVIYCLAISMGITGN